MEGIVLAVSALRRDYRDSITQYSSTAVHRKNVDNDKLAKSCYICLRGWEIGGEATTLHCECLAGPFLRRAAALYAGSQCS